MRNSVKIICTLCKKEIALETDQNGIPQLNRGNVEIVPDWTGHLTNGGELCDCKDASAGTSEVSSKHYKLAE